MTSRRSQLAFAAVIGAALLLIVVSQVINLGGGGDDDGSVNAGVEVVGYIGSEKRDFLDNPEIQRILRERYGLEIDYTAMGSIEQVTTADTTGVDFLWPSNEVALEFYRDRNAGSVKSATIFNSPIVMYSWSDVVNALSGEGFIRLEGDIYYVDIEALVTYILDDHRWSDVGMDELIDGIKIYSTNPTRSNSGNMFYGLLANILAEGDVANDQTVEAVLPTIKAYYDSLGNLETSSGFLFDKYISQGMGAYPLIMGYESQLIEFSLQNEASRAMILDQVRIVYPRPTVWSSHPVIALTENGERVMEALQDEEIQRLAWEQHGFRSGLLGIDNDPSVMDVANIPESITAVIPLPRPSVMFRLNEYLESGV